MLEVLIVDPNKVYARMIKNVLIDQLKDARVDIAGNVHELRRRLGISKYDVILADLSISFDGDVMKKMLDDVNQTSTVIVWSTLDRKNEGTIQKPLTRFALKDAISAMIEDTIKA
jgi:CheY-like chemotaxis protein